MAGLATTLGSGAMTNSMAEVTSSKVILLIGSNTTWSHPVFGSMVKQALKRVRPGFAESYYGFRSFNAMLEAARDAGALALERDEKSGGYVVRLAAGLD